MEHLAERDATERGVDEVVERGLIRLAEVLPRAAAERGETRRLPEVHPVGAARREVVVALIRVADLIDGEVIEVPFPTPLHVRPPGLRRDLGGVLSANQIRELVHAVDRSHPWGRRANAARWATRARASVIGRRRRGGKLNRRRWRCFGASKVTYVEHMLRVARLVRFCLSYTSPSP